MESTMYTHDYSPRDHEVVDYGFCEHPALPGFWLRGPSVDVEERDDFFTCMGAAQTMGVYVSNPFPELLTQEFGVTAWNLGIGGASPHFFLQHDEVLKYVNKGKFVILQVMTARDEANERFTPTPVASQVIDHKTGNVVFSGTIWQDILENEPENLDKYIAQSRASWERHMVALIDRITVPIIHFWFAPKPLEAPINTGLTTVSGIIDEFPQFITGDNLGYLTDANPLVTCLSNRQMEFDLRSRYTGKVIEVDYKTMDRTGTTSAFRETRNFYYPSPQMHWDAAAELSRVIKARGLL